MSHSPEQTTHPHLALIDAEIAWCADHPDLQAHDTDVRSAFIAGLKQARFLIAKAVVQYETET